MRKHLYQFLALVCLLGVIAIWFFDGYMGIYDTLTVDQGKREQEIELYQWLKADGAWAASGKWGTNVPFHYEVDNRQFSNYAADIEVSLWHDGEKLRHLISQPLLIDAFGEAEVEWVLDTAEIEPSAPVGNSFYEYTIIIRWGETERKLSFYIVQ